MSQLSRIALRNVGRNKRRSVITLIAIFIGVFLVVVVRGFFAGFLDMSVRSVVESKSGALQIHRKGYLHNIEGAPLKLSMPYTPELVGKIRSVPGVTGVSGRIQFTGLVSNGLNQTMFIGRGLDVATERQACPRSGQDVVEGGRPLQPGDYDQALVGLELAQSFNAVTTAEKTRGVAPAAGSGASNRAPANDLLTLASSSPEGRANSLNVNVAGKTNSGFAFENKRVMTVPLKLAQDLLNMNGKVTEYAVAVDNLDHLDRIVNQLQATLGADYEVTPWSDLNPFLRDIINRQKVVFAGISLVLFVIVLSGVVNTMLMSVFERVREIGTMLAVGVRQGQVRTMFLFEAGILGLVGGLGGAIAGRLMVAYLHSRGIPMPVAGSTSSGMLYPVVSPGFIVGAVLAATVAALISAAYPSWKASKLNPVDALRSV